ncbi:hypothetical protein BASA81_006132 [Batrachochytrium salamandrivorans]|nr:hypothetical protein BASA81_006132 [Batrachochytrium salamandrivorans]
MITGEDKATQQPSQRFSGIFEPSNEENLDDHYIISILDPTANSVGVWLVRLGLFWGLFVVCGFFITFSNNLSTNSYGVLLGAALAYVVCIGAYLLEAYVVVPYWYRNEIGRPMVHWMSWAVILDIIYHAVNPLYSVDFRQQLVADDVPVLTEVSTETQEENEFWMDFVADVGDGFNPTFAVFTTMAQAELRVAPQVVLPRAQLLVVGGDICYPWPRYDDIMSRFIRPLSWAFPIDMQTLDTRERNMYVMPGNHEWADGLRNFRRLVLGRTHIGAWQVKNRTPYFASKLPHGWWMFCVDPGSESSQDLDAIQINYFTKVIQEQTTPEDRFILCVHEPDWIKNSVHGYSLFKQLALFREEVLGSRLRLSLAGDLHYYRRMEEISSMGQTVLEKAPFPSYVSTRRQLIVAGNGGGFSHPTYVPDGTTNAIRLGEPHVSNGPQYQTCCNHPTVEASREMYSKGWTTGFSFGKNHAFGSITGLVYVGMCLAVSPLDYYSNLSGFPTGYEVLANSSYLLRMVTSFWFYPSAIFLSVVLFVIGTTSQAMHTRQSIALHLGLISVHIILHMGTVLAFRKLIDACLAEMFALQIVEFGTITAFCFASNTFMFIVGFFLGPWITAVLLKISQDVFAASYNEGTSTIEYQDDKGFLRMKLTAEGIELYSMGIRKVPRKWKPRKDRTNASPSHFECADLNEIEPFVVERVKISKNDTE